MINYLFPIHLNRPTYVMGLHVRLLDIFAPSVRGSTLESDVYRHEILTYKDSPCTERVEAANINQIKNILTI